MVRWSIRSRTKWFYRRRCYYKWTSMITTSQPNRKHRRYFSLYKACIHGRLGARMIFFQGRTYIFPSPPLPPPLEALSLDPTTGSGDRCELRQRVRSPNAMAIGEFKPYRTFLVMTYWQWIGDFLQHKTLFNIFREGQVPRPVHACGLPCLHLILDSVIFAL